jgi:predicted Zn-dependent protease
MLSKCRMQNTECRMKKQFCFSFSIQHSALSIRSLSVLFLVTVLGTGGYFGGRNLWAYRHLCEAEAAAARRDFQQAYAQMQVCLRVWPRRADIHFRAARLARRADRLREAEHHLRMCQELEGVTPANGLEASLLEAQHGRTGEVENALHNLVLQKRPETPLILEALAKGYIRIYRIDSAARALSLLLEQEPDNGEALVLRKRLLVHSSRAAEALNDLRRAVELYPDNDAWRQELAELLLQQSLAEEALPHYECLRQHRGEDITVLVGLVRCWNLLGKSAEARPLIESLLQRDPENPFLLADRGQLELEAGNDAEAERCLHRAFARMPTDYQIGYKLFTCLSRQNKENEARELLTKLNQLQTDMMRLRQIAGEVEKSKSAADLRYEAGKICLRYEQNEEAIRWFFGALQDDSRHAPAHQALAECYQRIGELQAAAYHRQRAAAP